MPTSIARMPNLVMFRALWAYRGFVWSSVKRELGARYRESLLGGFWSIANPLTMILIYTVIFSQIMRAGLPGHEQTPFAFSIYLCAGVITWGLFAEMLTRLSTVFLEHSHLIKKASFPRICLPAVVTLFSLINFGIVLILYLAFLAIIGHWPGWLLLALLPLLSLQILFTAGLGVFVGTLNVFFRDVGQFTGVILQFWFWLTPIVYTIKIVPASVADVMRFNPLLPLFAGYQGIFLDRRMPDFVGLLPLVAVTLLFLLLGAYVYLTRAGEMVDEL